LRNKQQILQGNRDMNTPIDPQAQENRPQINEQRRRLTKGGLAAPIVVGALLSRPVLGAAPHNCTISGQLSGNVSTHTQGDCTLLGKSHTTLTTEYAQKTATTILSEFPLLVNNYVFISNETNVLTLTPGSGNNTPPATIQQVLAASSLTGDLLYAQKALVLLLNAKGLTDTSIYPLTEFQARQLFKSAADPSHPQFVDTNPNVTWNYNPDVKNFIDVLYH
jgi:hypothetical protein